MRRLLDFLYDGAAWLAALAMIGVLVMVLLSIVSRQLGFHVPGTDAYAGYRMAAAGFLALAHTLKRNEHIRVTLLLRPAAGPRAAARWRCGRCRAAVLLAALFAFYSVRLAWSRTPSTTSPPATTPRRCGSRSSPWPLGTVILLVALVDEWVLELRGRRAAGRRADGGPAQ